MRVIILIILAMFVFQSEVLCASQREEYIKKINPNNLPLGSNKNDPRRYNYHIVKPQPEMRSRDTTPPRSIQEKQNFLKKRLTGR